MGVGHQLSSSGKVNRRCGRVPDSIPLLVTIRGTKDFPEGLLTRATTVEVSVAELGNLPHLVHGTDR